MRILAPSNPVPGSALGHRAEGGLGIATDGAELGAQTVAPAQAQAVPEGHFPGLYFRPFVTEGWRCGRSPNMADESSSDPAPRPWRTTPAHAGQAGFTLLHLLGVLLIITILLLTLMPPRIRQIDLEARQREAAALSVLATGLRNHILDHRRVPAASTVFSDMAAKLGWSLPMVTTNARGNPRVFVVDPGLQLGAISATTLPYVQGQFGVTNVAGLRLLLVSSLNSELPEVITAPGTNDARAFELLWNSSDNLMPFGWSWGGNFEDIVVQRLSLVPMFAQVVLHNASTDTGRFSIDSLATPTNHVALPASYYSSLYFVRTLLGLHSSTGTVQAVQILQDISFTTNGPPYFLSPTFVYEKSQWRGRYYSGTEAQRHKGEDLQAAYDLFMSGPANVYGINPNTVNQQTVTLGMYMFMSNYVYWDSRDFKSTVKPQVQAAQSIMASQLGAYCNKKATTQ